MGPFSFSKLPTANYLHEKKYLDKVLIVVKTFFIVIAFW